MPELVSILIPCHNAAPWIAETLDSTMGQTWPRVEIIVVDDGSTDASREIVGSFSGRGVRLISQGNRGASSARNAALREARGEFLQFLDADDLLAPDKIEVQLRHPAARTGSHLLSGSWGRFERTIAEARFKTEPVCRDFAPVDWLVASWSGGGMMHPGAWLTPRRLAEAAGPWDENLSLNDDGEYFARVILASQGVRFCPGARSYYRSNLRNSLSNETSPRGWRSAFTSFDLGARRLLAAEDSPRTRAACASRFRDFYFQSYPDAPELRAEAEARIRELGHVLGRPRGGPAFKAITRVLGWRLTKRIQKFAYGRGYRRLMARFS